MKLLDKDILFFDNHLLVVRKPANLLTQSDSKENLETIARSWLKERGKNFAFVVHRLDKEVEGIVVIALSSKALSRLNEEMRNHNIKRVYLAKVEGHFKEKNGQLIHFLSHGSHIAELDPNGKRASLFYKVLEEGDDYSMVEVELETGRYHQIRAQMAFSGHPIFGDQKYESSQETSLFLKNTHLSFVHPVTKKPLIFNI